MRLLVAIFVLYSVLCRVRCAIDPGDGKVIQALAKAIGAERALGWDPSVDPCSWKGMACAGTRVVGIDFQSKSLYGTLPSNFNQLSELASLSIQNNHLSGPLPTFSGMSSLKSVFVNNNNFSSIPNDFFKGLTSLQVIGIDSNPFKPWTVPQDLTDSSSLVNFTATATRLTGPIPSFFGDQFPNLCTLSLALNNLSGSIPPSFASSTMAVLWLNGQTSTLSGNINVIAEMTSLVQVWLHNNAFTGAVPDLSKLVSLKDIRLSNNKFTGPLPQSLMNLPSLTNVSLFVNALQGPYPSFAKSVAAEVGDVNTNSFCLQQPGPCDGRVDTLLQFASDLGYPYVLASNWKGNNPCNSWMYVSCSVDGEISVLNMNSLQLSGTLSPALANFSKLSIIILNNNNLTGTIPTELTKLQKLTKLDLRNNNLSGKVPPFARTVQVLVTGNPNIGKNVAPTPSGSPSTPGTPGGSSKSSDSPGKGGSTPSSSGSSSNVAAIAGGVVGGIVGLALVGCLCLCCLKRRRKFGRVQSPNTSEFNPPASTNSDSGLLKMSLTGTQSAVMGTMSQDSSFGAPSDVPVVEAGNMFISMQVLRTVTNNFSEENVLGRGGFGVVYKGELHDGTQIAVKRMESGVMSNKGLNEFQAEIAVLTKVRHRHLVALLGYCIEGNERLLVYEHMPQGPLSHHLFEWESRNLKPLDWTKRLAIALDVARGVEYLHSLAQKSFIHRDLKPSNILLGDDMRAKVSDFGLVRLAPDGKYSVETRLAGTFGYLAPEYAVTGRVTTKADVFSFGVVLMELITGRKALDDSQPEESMHLVTWFRRMHINKENFRNVLDRNLDISEETFKSICTVAELAGHCTAREPQQRPDMGHAVNVLSSLVEQWKPSTVDDDEIYGIDLEMSLPQALKKWQALEDSNVDTTMKSMDNTQTSIPTRPSGFADSFTSADGR